MKINTRFAIITIIKELKNQFFIEKIEPHYFIRTIWFLMSSYLTQIIIFYFYFTLLFMAF